MPIDEDSEDLSKFVSTEVAYSEDENLEQSIDQEENTEQQLESYGETLVDLNKFNELYKKDLSEKERKNLESELFANLPHAIKYLSPDAAQILADNLPSLSSLNPENLPEGFNLKMTKEGEIVLDYE